MLSLAHIGTIFVYSIALVFDCLLLSNQKLFRFKDTNDLKYHRSFPDLS